MNVEKNIIDLLYKYDCVIIPEFGGFLAHRKSAVFHPMDYTFDPPRKVIGFNSDLIHSDGLLAHEIAKKNNLSYTEALETIHEMVKSWKETMDAGKTLEIDSLGSFKIIDSKLEFSPNKDLNFSFDSFGMYPVQGQYILRETKAETTETRQTGGWLSYAAAIGFAVMAGTAAFFANDNLIQPQLSSVLPLLDNQITINRTIEKPVAPVINLQMDDDKETNTLESSTINNAPLEKPSINTEEASLDLSVKTYQVIGGSFKVYSKAMEHQAYLKKKGYERAVIVGKVGNFYMVAFDTFNNLEDAAEYKRELEKKGFDVFMRP
ncbi:hypothetical protein GO491_05330 [Flavobacteriaceae bacterium Ap0902]|nr:hypothetical protein [Flavobacteriaceae bacterium Ap0902]